MLKRWITAMLTTVLLTAAFTGCAQTKALDAKEVYTKAMEVSAQNKSMDCDMNMLMKMESDAEKLEIRYVIGTKVSVQAEDAVRLEMDMLLSMTDEADTNIHMTYADNCLYLQIADQKIKSSTSAQVASALMEQMGEGTGETLMGVDALETVTAQKTQTGYALQFTLKNDVTNTFLKDFLDQAMADAEDADCTVNSFTGTMELDEDYRPVKYNLAINMDLAADGDSAALDVALDMVMNAYGDDVQVEAPADADSYVEIDSSYLDSLLQG